MPTESGRTAKPDAGPSYPSKWTGPKHFTLHSLFGHIWPTLNMRSHFTYTCQSHLTHTIHNQSIKHMARIPTHYICTSWLHYLKPLYHLFLKLGILVWRKHFQSFPITSFHIKLFISQNIFQNEGSHFHKTIIFKNRSMPFHFYTY